MMQKNSTTRPSLEVGVKQRAGDKVWPIKVADEKSPPPRIMRKPSWIRSHYPGSPEVARLKKTLRNNKLHTVCEEANCPNLGECFGKGTATFMIMGDICTRRCPFCDVAHGRPNPLDEQEPAKLAETVAAMGLKYVVITSVDRDDLRDGGAGHFASCIHSLRTKSPELQIEILTPDFRGRMDKAISILAETPPDVFNHNMETIPRLYSQSRPGADYQYSLDLLRKFKQVHPNGATKSGLMLGLGETFDEVKQTMRDLRDHNVDMLTLGQYLQPSRDHLPVDRFVTPEEFDQLREAGEAMGFRHVASGPMVRSSYHADIQADGIAQER